LFAKADGHIKFEEKGKPVRRYVNVIAAEAAAAK
jgi:ribosomal protein L27